MKYFTDTGTARIRMLAPLVLCGLLASCKTDVADSPSVHIPAVIQHIKGNFSIQGSSDLPDSLAPVFPNPFNLDMGDTTINVIFTSRDTASIVLLIQNPLGDSVAVFENQSLPGGIFSGTWQPKNSNGDRLKAGLYFITLRIENDGQNRDYINSELLSIEAN